MPSDTKDIYNLINNGPEDMVRAVFRLLCKHSIEAEKKAEEFHQEIINHQIAPPAPVAGHATSSTITRKRKADEVLYCINCDECYTEDENTATSCRYHPESFEPDWEDDNFADCDECHEEWVYTKDCFDEFPSAYTFSCCERRGDEAPCIVDFHESSRKKSRTKQDDSVPANAGRAVMQPLNPSVGNFLPLPSFQRNESSSSSFSSSSSTSSSSSKDERSNQSMPSVSEILSSTDQWKLPPILSYPLQGSSNPLSPKNTDVSAPPRIQSVQPKKGTTAGSIRNLLSLDDKENSGTPLNEVGSREAPIEL